MNNVRAKIAAGATVLGLGGLGGYALATNDGDQATTASPAAASQKPRVRTHVVHRTIHVPSGGGGSATAAAPAAATAPAPAAPAPVSAPVSAVAPSTPAPAQTVSTHTSGSAGSGYSGDDEGEHERGDIESDAGDD